MRIRANVLLLIRFGVVSHFQSAPVHIFVYSVLDSFHTKHRFTLCCVSVLFFFIHCCRWLCDSMFCLRQFARASSILCLYIYIYICVRICVSCGSSITMAYIFLVIMLVLVIYLISFISLRFCCRAWCVYIQVYFISTSFGRSFGRCDVSFSCCFFFISFFLLVFRKYAHLSNTLCVACRSYTTHISSFSSLFCNTFIFCFIYFSHRTQSMHIIFPLRDTGAVDECSTVPSLARCVLFFAVVAVRFIYMAILHCDCDCHCYHLRLIFCSCSPATFFHRSCKNSKHSKREQLPTACA